MDKRDHVSATDTDRPPGFLTPEQREFIWNHHVYAEHGEHSQEFGELEEPERFEELEELSPEALRQRWYRIRKRARNAIADFSFLLLLPDGDKRAIFEEFRDADSVRQAELEGMASRGIWDLFALSFFVMGRQIFFWFVEREAETHIAQEYRERGKHAYVDVEVTVDADTVTVDELKTRYDNKEELTTDELYSLEWNNRISHEESEEYENITGR